MPRITLTVFFDGQFWVGIFERTDNGKLIVARVVFGAEPRDQQVHEMVLCDFYKLCFSPPVEGAKMQIIASNVDYEWWGGVAKAHQYGNDPRRIIYPSEKIPI